MISSGLLTWVFIPAARAAEISSLKALAVVAMMGIVRASGCSEARICLVASCPSITGICTSIRIASYSPGFVVEMDDFGNGYSSLHMLHEMPVDVLKLDMKFIQSEPVTPVNQEIMRFIINLAHLMSLSVVAEGVETEEQLERLRRIGCECVQGYYFSKPVQVKEFEKLMEENDAVGKAGNQDS